MDSVSIFSYTPRGMTDKHERIGGVIISHGQVATELLSAAETIVGEVNHVVAVSIGWHDDVDRAREEINQAIARVQVSASDGDEPAGVLVLTDMFGGTPTNLAVTLITPRVEVITGVNLPMLLKLARPQKPTDLADLAREMREHGRNAIWVASELLRGETA